MLRIRQIEEKDLERLLEIINEPDIIQYMPLERPVKMDKIQKWYQSARLFKKPAIFVLELDKVIGACSIYEDGKMTIWVERGYRGKGYGTVTVDWLKEYARENRLPGLWLECFKSNKQALDFYHELGFQDTGEKGNSCLLELKI